MPDHLKMCNDNLYHNESIRQVWHFVAVDRQGQSNPEVKKIYNFNILYFAIVQKEKMKGRYGIFRDNLPHSQENRLVL